MITLHENKAGAKAEINWIVLKMPPKEDVKTLASKMENSGEIFYESIEEFEIIFSVKPDLKTLETAFHQVETRYRLIKKQQETDTDEQTLVNNQETWRQSQG